MARRRDPPLHSHVLTGATAAFAADIARTGYYGFPLHDGLVKIARHGPGEERSLDGPRNVTAAQQAHLRRFLADTMPDLARAEVGASAAALPLALLTHCGCLAGPIPRSRFRGSASTATPATATSSSRACPGRRASSLPQAGAGTVRGPQAASTPHAAANTRPPPRRRCTGFKFAPVLGRAVLAAMRGQEDPLFAWRDPPAGVAPGDAARAGSMGKATIAQSKL